MGLTMNRVIMQLHNDMPTVVDAITDEPIVSYPKTAAGFEKCSKLVAEHNAEVEEERRNQAKAEFRALMADMFSPFMGK